MENIGVDIGAFKTTIATSHANGTVISDEMSKRSVPSVLELTCPMRKFGNHVGGPLVSTVHARHRLFTDLSHSRCADPFLRLVNSCSCTLSASSKPSKSENIGNSENVGNTENSQNPNNPENPQNIGNSSNNPESSNSANCLEDADVSVHRAGQELSKVQNIPDIPENEAYLFYHLNYLASLPNSKTKNFCLTVPYFYSLSERKQLFDLCSLLGLNVLLVTDIVCSALFYVLMHGVSEPRFCILDLGHSKTTFGVFDVKTTNGNTEICPVSIDGIQKGGLDFDIKLINFICTKFQIPQTKLNIERLLPHIEKLKKSLNNLEDVRFLLETGEDAYFISLTKEEYLQCIKNDLEDIQGFLENCKIKHNIESSVEIIGGNSFHSSIQEITKTLFKTSHLLNPHEACATGSALFGAVKRFGSKRKINAFDINRTKIESKMFYEDNETNRDEKLHEIGMENIPFDDCPIYTNYKTTKSFFLEIFSDKKYLGKFHLKNPNETTKYGYRLNKNGTFEMITDSTESNDESFSIETITKNNFTTIKTTNDLFKTLEDENKAIGKMRNTLEASLMNIPISKLDLSDEDIQKLDEIKNTLIYEPMSSSLKEEIEKKETYDEKLSFILEKTNAILTSKKEKVQKKLLETENFITNNNKIFARGIYTLKGKCIKIKEQLNQLHYGLQHIENVIQFDENIHIQQLNDEMEAVQTEINKIQREKEEKEKQSDTQSPQNDSDSTQKDSSQKEATQKESTQEEAAQESTNDESPQ